MTCEDTVCGINYLPDKISFFQKNYKITYLSRRIAYVGNLLEEYALNSSKILVFLLMEIFPKITVNVPLIPKIYLIGEIL